MDVNMAKVYTLENIVYPRTRWRSQKAVHGDLDQLLMEIRQKINIGYI